MNRKPNPHFSLYVVTSFLLACSSESSDQGKHPKPEGSAVRPPAAPTVTQAPPADPRAGDNPNGLSDDGNPNLVPGSALRPGTTNRADSLTRFRVLGNGYGGFLDQEKLPYFILAGEVGREVADPLKDFEGIELVGTSLTPETCSPTGVERVGHQVTFAIKREGTAGAQCRIRVTATRGAWKAEETVTLRALSDERVRASRTTRSFQFRSSGYDTDTLGILMIPETGERGTRCIEKSRLTEGIFTQEAYITPVDSQGTGRVEWNRALSFLLPQEGLADPSRTVAVTAFHDEVFPKSGPSRVFGTRFLSRVANTRLPGGERSTMSLSVEEYRACARGKIASSYSWGFEYASLIRFHGFATEDADALDVRGLLADPEFDYTSAEKKLRGIGEANLVVAHTGGVVPEVDAILAGTKCSMENLRECAEDSGRILQAFSDFERKPRSLALDDLRSSPLAVIGVNLKDGPVFGFLPR